MQERNSKNTMKRKTSAMISLCICLLSAALLLIWLFTFPRFFHWFYADYHGLDPLSPYVERVIRTVVTTFYCCAPFAAAALAMLVGLLWNVLKDRVFIARNVSFLRYISWCCYAVTLAALAGGFFYVPLFIIAFAAGVVGTLLRVVKNMMQSAVELREENDLTI